MNPPMAEASTPLRRTQSTSNLQYMPSMPMTPVPGSSGQQRTNTPCRSARSADQKLQTMFDVLQDVGWSLSEFLYYFFRVEVEARTPSDNPTSVKRSKIHENKLRAFLDGTSKPHFGRLIDLIHKNSVDAGYRANDPTNPGHGKFFSTSMVPEDIQHARPALTTWAVHLVGELVDAEAGDMIKRETGLHMRAKAKEGGRDVGEKVTWAGIDSFSMEKLQKISQRNAPIMWHVLSSYVVQDHAHSKPGQVVTVRQYRPQNLVVTNALMSMTFGRSNRASLFQLCRGIWLFAVKAPSTVYRVESRLGLSVTVSTVYNALKEMAEQKRTELREAFLPGSGRFFNVVIDNTQTYAKVRDPRLGRENQMITGLVGTAVEMENFDPQAFNLRELLARQALQEHKGLSADLISDDLNGEHLQNVDTIQFIQAIVGFAPKLSEKYHKETVALTALLLTKKPIPPNCRSKVSPLATNSADEMRPQGLKEGVLDFMAFQMGLSSTTLDNKGHLMSGDGKTFNMFLLLMKLLGMEEGDFESFRWLIPLLEIWHTKWTDLSRVIRAHWGISNDPSSLACMAKLARCPTPSDLKKVDFYSGAHLIDLALDAHLLNCWELHFRMNDLATFFEDPRNVPTFDVLVNTARMLARRHATTRAHQWALSPDQSSGNQPPSGSTWVPKPTKKSHESTEDVVMEDETQSVASDELSDLERPLISDVKDTTLANAALFMRDAIWWREVRNAVAEGDPGRIWEIFKV
ncbi:hypothetical protein Hypma_004158 [Hypsizygus marmoreus]|uniref:DUF6589 domain-containing protein n=1 Tax=Hypsizygus marmoreus TaxID=39966 RepID=A0A369J230_HYPMA|nr:hypothetical protein Hypma_004158 [Hypsizygus marmoreus]